MADWQCDEITVILILVNRLIKIGRWFILDDVSRNMIGYGFWEGTIPYAENN
jgi:hypothetical protein